jgi:D-serine deaminase-like pyridoxal phosphate-dependent protein
VNPALEEARQRCRERYRDQIGCHRSEATTPVLLLDLDLARCNIATEAAQLRDRRTELRSHIKVQKSGARN